MVFLLSAIVIEIGIKIAALAAKNPVPHKEYFTFSFIFYPL